MIISAEYLSLDCVIETGFRTTGTLLGAVRTPRKIPCSGWISAPVPGGSAM